MNRPRRPTFDDPNPIMSGPPPPPPPPCNPEPAPPETRLNVTPSVSNSPPATILRHRVDDDRQQYYHQQTRLPTEGNQSPSTVVHDTQPLKTKRPLSYPCCGPEPQRADLPPDFDLTKRNSDPPKPVTVTNPVKGKAQVKPFTKESLERLERKTVQLVREYGFQPRRKLSVEDGSRLPAKYEPFPKNLYGRPLEEIDNFIYDEVGLRPDRNGKVFQIHLKQ